MLGGWKAAKKNHTDIDSVLSKKRQFKRKLVDRISQAQLETGDARAIIARYDGATSFFYCDPPYFNSDCGHYRDYTEADFKLLLTSLAGIKGKFLMSAYPSPILQEAIEANGWQVASFSTQVSINSTSKAKRIKTELLVANYPL